MVRFCLALILLLSLPLAGRAQDVQLSDQSRISLLTVLPGDQIWSIYGHSAFRVTDPIQGFDYTFNYGTFDFRNPLVFSARFTYGQLDYMLSAIPFERAMVEYRDYERRPVIEQVLNLSPEERNAVFQFLQVNLLPQNRTYRYDFLFDNCSTRIRDVLERSVPSRIQFPSGTNGATSFRNLLDPYALDRPFLDVGYDLLLGMPTDRVATTREKMFLPIDLMNIFDRSTIEHDGARQPLVTSRDTVFWIEGYRPIERSLPYPAILAWLLLAAGVAATGISFRKNRAGRGFWDGLLFGFAGFAGLLITFLWFISEHHVTDGNWHLAWAWPTHLVAAFLVARRPAPWFRRYLQATAVACALMAVAWFILPQEMHPALLPIVLLIAIRAAWLSRREPVTVHGHATGK